MALGKWYQPTGRVPKCSDTGGRRTVSNGDSGNDGAQRYVTGTLRGKDKSETFLDHPQKAVRQRMNILGGYSA